MEGEKAIQIRVETVEEFLHMVAAARFSLADALEKLARLYPYVTDDFGGQHYASALSNVSKVAEILVKLDERLTQLLREAREYTEDP